MLKEKIKPIHILLILIIIILYSYLFGLFNFSNGNEENIELGAINQRLVSEKENMFPNHRNDPFLSKKVRKPAKKKIVQKPIEQIVQKQIIRLPAFKIIGVSENDTSKQISVEMNNQFFLLNEKEVFFGVKINKIEKDSIHFEYQKQIFKQYRPRF
jgi:hypothetical protein